MKIVAFDSHKRYTLARVKSQDGQLVMLWNYLDLKAMNFVKVLMF